MQIGYILREGFSGFRRAKLSMVAAIFTIATSLLLLSVFSILLLNANSLIEALRDRVEMEVFLADTLTQAETLEVRTLVENIEGVREVRYVSKEEAAEIFRQEFGEDIHKVLDFNPLPASLKVFLKDGYKTAEAAQGIVERVEQVKGVDEVIYRRALLEMLDTRATTFLWLAFGLGIFIALSSVVLVGNTIRLAIYAKRKTIQTMKLIGATRWFIRVPFLLEGLVQGFIGGGAAAFVVFVVFELLGRWLAIHLAELVAVEKNYYIAIVAVGCLLGVLGSVLSIRRFISEPVVEP